MLSDTRLIQSGEPMCEQCENLQKQIDQFSRILQHRFDPLTEERLKAALAEMERRKEELIEPLAPFDPCVIFGDKRAMGTGSHEGLSKVTAMAS